jgi:hypothetical protein
MSNQSKLVIIWEGGERSTFFLFILNVDLPVDALHGLSSPVKFHLLDGKQRASRK